MSDVFVPPDGAVQLAVNVKWGTQHPCEEFPVWVMPLGNLCPDGKPGYKVIDPLYKDSSGWLCECHARRIE